MRAISPSVINEQKACPPSMPSMREVEAEMQQFNWQEATSLIEFHTTGQFVGVDGEVYKMTAEYADDATKVFPTVLVTVTDENGNVDKHHIDITKIDTGNATPIQMFALCSHADTKRGRYGDIAENILSSWDSLLFYRNMQMLNGNLETSGQITEPGAETCNWREIISCAAERLIDDKSYDIYLNVNRMKDMLDYYSYFDGRPDAFEDTFHAIRDYEFIRVISLDNNINIEIFDKQKKIVCTDLNKDFGINALWGIELTDDELEKAIEIAQSPYKAFMGDYSFWESILTGESQLEEYDRFVCELKKNAYNDNMFANCPSKVSRAWKRAQEKTGFNGLGLKEMVIPEIGLLNGNMEMDFVSEYMYKLIECMKKGIDTNLLGTTVESAIDFAKQNINKLEQMDFKQMSAENRKLKIKEKIFYYQFLEYLDPTQKYDPVSLLLKG